MNAIFRREFKSQFNNISGFVFTAIVICALGVLVLTYNLMGQSSTAVAPISDLTVVLALVLPILTVGSVCSEFTNGTYRLLYSLPIRSYEIVLAKFAAAFCVFLIPSALVALLPLILKLFGGEGILVSYIAVIEFVLFGAAVIAIGMFISAISKKKWISAVVIYSVLLLLFVLYIVSGLFPSGSLVADALSVISLFGATEELIYGVFDIRAIVYYISIIVVFLLLTVRVLEKKRFA